MGFVFYLLGMVWRHFSVKTFLAIRFSFYEKFMHGVWDLNHFFPFFIIIIF